MWYFLENLVYLPVILLFINFFISGIFINLIQIFLWIFLKPFNLFLYRKINYYLLYLLWIQILFVAEWWSSSTCSIITDDATWEKMGKEHAIVVMNHSFEVDWLMGWLVCEQTRLIASSKVFMKKVIKYIPIIGWAWQFGEIVFLERNWEADKLIMEKQVANFADYPDPVWLLLFAEGTRFTEKKHAASIAFAEKSGLPALKNLLLPRTKGFYVTAQQLRGKFPAIYCATLAFNTKEGAKPTLKNMLLGRRVIGEMLLERIPLNDVPADSVGAANWLHENYQHKDKMLEYYKKEGAFPQSLSSGRHYFEGPIRCHYRPRRLWSLIVMVVTCYITLPPALNSLYILLCSGIANLLVALFLLLTVIFALYKLVSLTKISKGSSYGHVNRSGNKERTS